MMIDRDYHLKRADDEAKRIAQAVHPAARAAHEQLRDSHLARAQRDAIRSREHSYG